MEEFKLLRDVIVRQMEALSIVGDISDMRENQYKVLNTVFSLCDMCCGSGEMALHIRYCNPNVPEAMSMERHVVVQGKSLEAELDMYVRHELYRYEERTAIPTYPERG